MHKQNKRARARATESRESVRISERRRRKRERHFPEQIAPARTSVSSLLSLIVSAVAANRQLPREAGGRGGDEASVGAVKDYCLFIRGLSFGEFSGCAYLPGMTVIPVAVLFTPSRDASSATSVTSGGGSGEAAAASFGWRDLL